MQYTPSMNSFLDPNTFDKLPMGEYIQLNLALLFALVYIGESTESLVFKTYDMKILLLSCGTVWYFMVIHVHMGGTLMVRFLTYSHPWKIFEKLIFT